MFTCQLSELVKMNMISLPRGRGSNTKQIKHSSLTVIITKTFVYTYARKEQRQNESLSKNQDKNEHKYGQSFMVDKRF